MDRDAGLNSTLKACASVFSGLSSLQAGLTALRTVATRGSLTRWRFCVSVWLYAVLTKFWSPYMHPARRRTTSCLVTLCMLGLVRCLVRKMLRSAGRASYPMMEWWEVDMYPSFSGPPGDEDKDREVFRSDLQQSVRGRRLGWLSRHFL